jgi:hypothetical protein
VDVFVDRGGPPVWQQYALAPQTDYDAMFLVLDHATDYKSYFQ